MTAVSRRGHDESTSARIRRWGDEWWRALIVGLSRSDVPKTGRIYDIIGTQNLYGEESLFINLGYWKDNPATMDEASRNLARLVARAGDLNSSDTLLDCGCGYGDQDIMWANEFRPQHITGLNVAEGQVAVAERRVLDAGLTEKVDYVTACATDIPHEDETFTKVIALESAPHFPSRVEFFSEAFRVLKPGGRLVVADVVPKRTPMNARYRKEVAQRGWRHASPRAVRRAANVTAYRDLLLEVGFAEAQIQCITGDVYRPLAKFLRQRLRDEDMSHVNPLLRLIFSPVGFRLTGLGVNYIVAVAQKK